MNGQTNRSEFDALLRRRNGHRERGTSEIGTMLMLALACVLTLAWIGFTIWLAADILGLF